MNKQVEIKHSIFSAIAKSASEVKVLGKTDRNNFDKYDFVSIDKFLALVNPICSSNGLFPIVSQSNVEFYENTSSQGKKSLWARYFYDITLYHSGGEQLGPTNVMVSVPMNGAQASGSAQSYALKQFFRATLMIPTGDKDDADLLPTEPHSNDAAKALSDAWTAAILDSLPEDASDQEKAQAFANAISNEFKGKGRKALDNCWTKRLTMIERIGKTFPDLREQIEAAYNKRNEELDLQ